MSGIAPGTAIDIHQPVFPLGIDNRMNPFPSFESLTAERAFRGDFLFEKPFFRSFRQESFFPECGKNQINQNSEEKYYNKNFNCQNYPPETELAKIPDS